MGIKSTNISFINDDYIRIKFKPDMLKTHPQSNLYAKIKYSCWHQQSAQLNLKKYSNTQCMGVVMNYNWFPLKRLNIHACSIYDHGVAKIPFQEWPQLQHLYLNKNELTWRAIKDLCNRELQKQKHDQLRDIELSKCFVLSRLTVFEIQGNLIGNRGAKLLSKVNFCVLETLSISGCLIGNAGIGYLRKTRMPRISTLSLDQNKLRLDSFPLFTYFSMKNLDTLTIGEIKLINLLHLIAMECTYTGKLKYQLIKRESSDARAMHNRRWKNMIL